MGSFDYISVLLRGYPRRTVAQDDLCPAAVLLPLYLKQGVPHILLTRRTDHLEHHRGEIAFPGGRRDPEDPDLRHTALREAQEEMGIDPRHVKVLGRLDDFVSIHGYHVVPYVGTFDYPYPFEVSTDEIAEVIEVPVSVLRDPAVCRVEDWTHRGRVHPVCFYTVGRHEIWGLTAEILRQFLSATAAPAQDSCILPDYR